MCRNEIIPYVEGESDLPGESAEDMELDFENFKYTDPIIALDETTGYRIYQWAIEEGIRQGILAGTPYVSDDVLRPTGNYPSIRASAIGEPGDKARTITVDEDWLTEFLQPFAHDLLGELKTHPSVTAGLSRAWQHFEWVKGLRNTVPYPKGTTYYLSSDLKTATDFCTHEYSKSMLEGLDAGLDRTCPLRRACIYLICGPRVYEDPIVGDEFTTVRACLMGTPGVKAVLTMHNLCAELEATYRHCLGMYHASDRDLLNAIRASKGPPLLKWRHFACSGDDHTAQGPIEYLRCITSNHIKNGMKVSEPQNFISSFGSYYCEEMFLTVGLEDHDIWGVTTPLKDRDYLRHPHIDSLKVRLFSPCSKECESKDESNPAVGKARQAHGMIAWLSGGWESMKSLFSARWESRLEAFLPKDLIFRYLPVRLGGIEAPAFHVSDNTLRKIFKSIPPAHLMSIIKVMDGTVSPLVSRTLATFSSNARARGINAELVQDQIVEVLHNSELTGGLNEDELQLAAGVPDNIWKDLHYSRKLDVAKGLRLIPVNDAINLIDRPYLFRDILYPEMSRKHGIDPYRSAAYENKPWPLRVSMFYENLIKHAPQTDFSKVEETIKESTIESISKWAKSNISLDLPRELYFIPEAVVVTEKLCTLRTPLGLDLPKR
jgi:hypothetical protein